MRFLLGLAPDEDQRQSQSGCQRTGEIMLRRGTAGAGTPSALQRLRHITTAAT
jgi:hypothetical protein